LDWLKTVRLLLAVREEEVSKGEMEKVRKAEEDGL
jgi:hypothetical protein